VSSIETRNSAKNHTNQSSSNLPLEERNVNQNNPHTNQKTVPNPQINAVTSKNGIESSSSLTKKCIQLLLTSKSHTLQTNQKENDDYLRLISEEQGPKIIHRSSLSIKKSTSFAVELRKKLEEIQRKKQEMLKLSSRSNQKSELLNLTQKPTTKLSTNNRSLIKRANESISSNDESDDFEYRYQHLKSNQSFLDPKWEVFIYILLFFYRELDEDELNKMSPEELEDFYNKNYSSIIR
jgi:hypothetical protein